MTVSYQMAYTGFPTKQAVCDISYMPELALDLHPKELVGVDAIESRILQPLIERLRELA
jgi:cephalosporin hydroxylase